MLGDIRLDKIRILTFWNVPNYGTFMQAYALQKVMADRYPNCDVKQLSYLHKKHFDIYYSVNTNFRYWPINPKFYKSLINQLLNWKEIKRIRGFLNYYHAIPHVSLHGSKNADKEAIDLLVLGSDILWDYTIDFFGKDQHLFGLQIDAKRKISYAASFGTALAENGYPEYVKTGLLELNDISVREEKSKKSVKQISDRDAQIVLDPTFLWDFNTDLNIIKPKIKGDYVIVYGSSFSQELIDGARAYCQKNNLKLVCLNSLHDKFDWCDITINQNELDPFEWAGYFKYADAVMTCTFHGLIFGLIFNKRLAFHPTAFIMHKAASIIEAFGLNDVLINFTSFEEKVEWEWDYSVINRKIEEAKAVSLEFLDRNVNHE